MLQDLHDKLQQSQQAQDRQGGKKKSRKTQKKSFLADRHGHAAILPEM